MLRQACRVASRAPSAAAAAAVGRAFSPSAISTRAAFVSTASVAARLSVRLRPAPVRTEATVFFTGPLAAPARLFSTEATAECAAEPADVAIHRVLTATLAPSKLIVRDTSGGCGAFFKIFIVSPAFAGKNALARHRMVQAAIKDNIKAMHGLTIDAFAPEDAPKE
jgi:BolA protein